MKRLSHLPLLLSAAVWTFLLATAAAQVDVQVIAAKRNFLIGEPVAVTIEITNNAGRDLTFSSTPTQSWLQLRVKNGRGESMTPQSSGVFRSGAIAPNQTIRREIYLTSVFNMTRPGNYRFTAAVSPDGDQREYVAAGNFVNVSPGTIISRQERGVPGTQNEVREFRLLTFGGNSKTELYSQIWNPISDLPVHTKKLGGALMFPKPQTLTDNTPNNHILYRVSPDIYHYIVVDLEGAVIQAEKYKKGAANLRLEKFANGEVIVAGGVVYDATAEVERKAQIRRISERP